MTSLADTGLPREAPALNYRQWIATFIPALILAYAIIVWPAVYAGGVVAADTAMGALPPEQNYVLNRVFFPGIFVVAVLIFLAERPRFAPGNGLVIATLGAFWGLCGLSIIWALAPGQAASQFGLVSITLIGAGLAGVVSGSMERSFRACFWVAAVATFLNLAVVMTTPPGPLGHEGIYSHKNILGAVAAFFFLFAAWGVGQSRGRLMRYVGLLMIPAALYILWKSESKTALGFAFATPVLAVTFFLAKRYLRIALPVAFVLAVIFALALIAVLNWTGFTVGEVSAVITGDPTFTGRTDIWAFAFDRIAERPLLGYGFHSFWQIGDASPALHAPPGFIQVAPNGHNGYVDLMLQVGFAGFGLFLLLLLGVAGRISRLIDAKPWFGLFCTSLLVFVILHNLLESTWFEVLDINLIVFLTLMFTALGDREVFG